MRIRNFAFVAGLAAAMAASPAAALTIQSAPPKPEVAQRLTPSQGGGLRLEDTFAGGGRPELGSRFSGAPAVSGVRGFGFGPVRATVRTEPADPRWRDRRGSEASILLPPPRR